jgi:DNA polymerase-1
VRIDAALRAQGLDGVYMLLQIHDELIFELDRAGVEVAAGIVKREMEHAIELSVPLAVTLKTGATWYEVEPFEVDDDD